MYRDGEFLHSIIPKANMAVDNQDGGGRYYSGMRKWEAALGVHDTDDAGGRRKRRGETSSAHDMVNVVHAMMIWRWEIGIEPRSSHMIPLLWRDSWRAIVE